MKSYHLIPFISKWLYIKIYCNPHFANEILSSINSLITEDKNNIIKWYFIRYFDEDFHLRIRFYHETDKNAYSTYQCVAPFLNKLIEQDLIHRVSIDTYQPEFFRYGRDTFEFCEELFCQETELIINEYANKPDMLFFEIHNLITNYIDLFDIPNKNQFITNSKKIFEREFNLTKEIKKNIAVIMAENKDKMVTFRLPKKTNELLFNIQSKLNENKSKERVLRSLIHMLVNRAYEVAQRKHELIHYQVLEKTMKYTMKN